MSQPCIAQRSQSTIDVLCYLPEYIYVHTLCIDGKINIIDPRNVKRRELWRQADYECVSSVSSHLHNTIPTIEIHVECKNILWG